MFGRVLARRVGFGDGRERCRCVRHRPGHRCATRSRHRRGHHPSLRQKRVLLIDRQLRTPALRGRRRRRANRGDLRAVTVLATGREPLMVSGERLVPVQSLADAGAQRLFIERGRTPRAPDLVIGRSGGSRRRAIAGASTACHWRRARCLTCARSLRSSWWQPRPRQFRLLIGGRRSRMERHQTMRHARLVVRVVH